MNWVGVGGGMVLNGGTVVRFSRRKRGRGREEGGTERRLEQRSMGGGEGCFVVRNSGLEMGGW